MRVRKGDKRGGNMLRRVRKLETGFEGWLGQVRLGEMVLGELAWLANCIRQSCIGRTGIGKLTFGKSYWNIYPGAIFVHN